MEVAAATPVMPNTLNPMTCMGKVTTTAMIMITRV
jgi:hypothetical protein